MSCTFYHKILYINSPQYKFIMKFIYRIPNLIEIFMKKFWTRIRNPQKWCQNSPKIRAKIPPNPVSKFPQISCQNYTEKVIS